jgi:hypothetical protein
MQNLESWLWPARYFATCSCKKIQLGTVFHCIVNNNKNNKLSKKTLKKKLSDNHFYIFRYLLLWSLTWRKTFDINSFHFQLSLNNTIKIRKIEWLTFLMPQYMFSPFNP